MGGQGQLGAADFNQLHPAAVYVKNFLKSIQSRIKELFTIVGEGKCFADFTDYGQYVLVLDCLILVVFSGATEILYNVLIKYLKLGNNGFCLRCLELLSLIIENFMMKVYNQNRPGPAPG